jgi:hypothetical protein
MNLVIEYGIPISKNISREDMIIECTKHKELTVKDIMKKLKTKESNKTKNLKVEGTKKLIQKSSKRRYRSRTRDCQNRKNKDNRKK